MTRLSITCTTHRPLLQENPQILTKIDFGETRGQVAALRAIEYPVRSDRPWRLDTQVALARMLQVYSHIRISQYRVPSCRWATRTSPSASYAHEP